MIQPLRDLQASASACQCLIPVPKIEELKGGVGKKISAIGGALSGMRVAWTLYQADTGNHVSPGRTRFGKYKEVIQFNIHFTVDKQPMSYEFIRPANTRTCPDIAPWRFDCRPFPGNLATEHIHH